MLQRISMLLGALLAMANAAMAQSRVALDLNTHSEVTIDRPAATIWPLIVDPNSWKQGSKNWHHSGPVGQLGEIFAAGDPANKAKVEFMIENVQLVPNQRRTIKIYTPNGPLLGFAIWSLKESAGKTVVAYDVYSEEPVDAAQIKSKTPAQLDQAEREYVSTNQARFDRELVALKKMVERQ